MESSNLLNQILSSTRAPRELLLEYIKLKVYEAKKLDVTELLRKSGNGQFRESQAPGEKIASDIHSALVQQEFVNWDDDPKLASVENIAQELCDQTDKLELWEELFEQIKATSKPQLFNMSKPELVAELKNILEEGASTPISELCKMGDYKICPDLKYPHTPGEIIVDKILDLLLFQSWINPEDEPLLEEIFDIAGSLDKDVSNPKLWKELFELGQRI